MSVHSEDKLFETVLITGGAGYVGSALTPRLLDEGYSVKVVDTFWYGEDVFGEWGAHPGLRRVKMDIRDSAGLSAEMKGVDAVIHLACISNDPSYDLDPQLGKSINYDAFRGLTEAAAANGVKRFIYASSSSVYGVKDEPDVRETTPPEPLTDYSKFKLACENDLLGSNGLNGMEKVIIRPATVCGYAPRLRLDLTVNILTIHALVNRKIRIFGGKQLRPNIHIKDMVRAYQMLLKAPAQTVDSEAFNCGYQNMAVGDIGEIVRSRLGGDGIEIVYEQTSDNRSYHINSDKIRDRLGFAPMHTIEDAVGDISEAFEKGLIQDPMSDPRYINIKFMKDLVAN